MCRTRKEGQKVKEARGNRLKKRKASEGKGRQGKERVKVVGRVAQLVHAVICLTAPLGPHTLNGYMRSFGAKQIWWMRLEYNFQPRKNNFLTIAAPRRLPWT